MVARTKNLCRAHGGGAPLCVVDGCEKVAEPGGRCGAHGGGKRCKIEGCTKRRATKGLCYDHGGGRHCSLEWCNKYADKSGYCAGHKREKQQMKRVKRNEASLIEWGVESDSNEIVASCATSTTENANVGGASTVCTSRFAKDNMGVIASDSSDSTEDY